MAFAGVFARSRARFTPAASASALRTALPLGPVSRGDVLAITPFPNTLLVKEFTGEQILAALEHGVQDDNHDGAYIVHPAGFTYEADMAQPSGHRIVKAETAGKKGPERIDPKRRYKVVLTNYLAGGGDRYDMLKEGRVLSAPSAGDGETFEAYIAKSSPIRQVPRRRFVLLNKK